MRFLLIAILAVIPSCLGLGYWRASSHGNLWITLYDEATKPRSDGAEPVHLAASFRFFDASGTVLADARRDQGVVSPRHPEVGDCRELERQASFSAEARLNWWTCREALSRWVVSWASQVSSIEITMRDCPPVKLSGALKVTRGDWWLWWVPLPHVGGFSESDFTVGIRVDSHRCNVLELVH